MKKEIILFRQNQTPIKPPNYIIILLTSTKW